MREVNPDSLYSTTHSDPHSTIAVERDPATGKLLGFHEARMLDEVVLRYLHVHKSLLFIVLCCTYMYSTEGRLLV